MQHAQKHSQGLTAESFYTASRFLCAEIYCETVGESFAGKLLAARAHIRKQWPLPPPATHVKDAQT